MTQAWGLDKSLRARLGRSIRKWSAYACGISVFVAVGHVLSNGELLARFGPQVTLERVVLLYFAGCIASGVISGLLEPWARTWLTSMLAGVAYMFPMGLMLGLTLYSSDLTDWKLWLIAGGLAVWPGSGFGLFDHLHRRLG